LIRFFCVQLDNVLESTQQTLNNNNSAKDGKSSDKASASASAAADADLFTTVKSLERHISLLTIQEGYIKDEQAALKRELLRAREEVKRIQAVPLMIGQFLEMVDEDYGIASTTSGQTMYCRIMSTLDRQLLKTNTSIAMHRYAPKQRYISQLFEYILTLVCYI